MRIVFAALGICAIAFLAGVVGDLSNASQRTEPAAASGESVRVHIPRNAVYAHPLPALASVTPATSHVRFHRHIARIRSAEAKPHHFRLKGPPKLDPMLAEKARATQLALS